MVITYRAPLLLIASLKIHKFRSLPLNCHVNKPNKTPTTVPEIQPPIKPIHVLCGETLGNAGFFPQAIPVKKAKVSVVTIISINHIKLTQPKLAVFRIKLFKPLTATSTNNITQPITAIFPAVIKLRCHHQKNHQIKITPNKTSKANQN